MLVFLMFVQVAVWQYARGALRAAAMEAARAEAPYQAPPGACDRRFESTRNALLGGAIADQVGPASCVVGPEFVTVTVDATFEGWLPISPDWSFTVEATAVKEHAP